MKYTLDDLIAALRKLFGKEESVDTIMKPITKIATKLERHERKQTSASERRAEAAKRAEAKARVAADAAARAAAQRAKMLDTFA
jgi:hypothetical protein